MGVKMGIFYSIQAKKTILLKSLSGVMQDAKLCIHFTEAALETFASHSSKVCFVISKLQMHTEVKTSRIYKKIDLQQDYTCHLSF